MRTRMQDPRLLVAVSAGIAHSTGTESIRSLLMRADEALYEAKSAGRNRVQTHDLRHLAA